MSLMFCNDSWRLWRTCKCLVPSLLPWWMDGVRDNLVDEEEKIMSLGMSTSGLLSGDSLLDKTSSIGTHVGKVATED